MFKQLTFKDLLTEKYHVSCVGQAQQGKYFSGDFPSFIHSLL